MGHYKKQCPKNPKNNKWERDRTTIFIDQDPWKKTKIEDLDVKDVLY